MQLLSRSCGAFLIIVAMMEPALAACSKLSSADVVNIRSADSAYVKGWLENDRPAILSLFTDDAVIVPQNSAPIAGLREIARFWWPAGGKTTVTTFNNSIAEIGGCGDLAFTRGSYRFNFQYEASGQVQKLENRGNYLMLMRRAKGAWKITHRMWSDLPRR